MGGTRWLCVSLALVACCLQAQGVDKYTDENRPYEFGFNIEGEQHRHEKKDENGLIEGEFGFLTADGVYHVTVYATDENGNFHIRSMKNVRVKPYPGSERQGKVLPANQPPQQALQPPQQALQPPAQTQSVSPPAPLKPVVLEQPGRSCSHCSIPTSSPAPVPVEPQNPSYNGGQDSFGGQPGSQGEQGFAGGNYGQGQGPFVGGQGDQGFQGGQGGQDGQGNAFGGQSGYGAQGGDGGLSQNAFGQPAQNNFQNPQPGFDNSQYGQQQPAQQPQEGFNGQGQEGFGNAQNPQGISDSGVSGQRNPKQFEPSYDENTGVNPNYPSKPTLISAQMKVVDSNTDVNRLGPGENPGLPNGLTKNDMQNILYTFNYTVGFHGHQEEGYANGAKKGHYFITGRNGIRTRVDYEADENGFRPKITQEVLDVLSDEVPKPETEKDEKFGLKHYEFRWIYFPTNRR